MPTSIGEGADAAGGGIPAGSGSGSGGVGLRDCLAQNYERLYRKLLRYLGCPDQASDCLHDAWLHLGEMTVPADVRYPVAYVYRVACNLAMDRLRGNRPWLSLGDLEGEEDVCDPCPGPDQIAEARSELALLDRAINTLPYRHQSILFDLRINELTRVEVSARFGLSLRRIDTVLRQTLDHCVALMEKQRDKPWDKQWDSQWNRQGGGRLRRAPPPRGVVNRAGLQAC